MWWIRPKISPPTNKETKISPPTNKGEIYEIINRVWWNNVVMNPHQTNQMRDSTPGRTVHKKKKKEIKWVDEPEH